MNEEAIQDQAQQSGRATAVSVFEQANGMNDFPVLKAFQEYIEAEQTRARKRMLGLSIFFVVLLIVVVVTFSVIMASVISRDQQNLASITSRNQELSDKLLDIALRERTHQQPVINVSQPASDSDAGRRSTNGADALQPVLDRLEKLATSLNQPRTQGPVPTTESIPPPAATTPVAQIQPAADPALVAALRQQEEVRRQREVLASERAKLKAEREQLRREQVEQHRRRLYPEYYAQQDALRAEEEAKRAVPPPLPGGTGTAAPAQRPPAAHGPQPQGTALFNLPSMPPVAAQQGITEPPVAQTPPTPARVSSAPESKDNKVSLSASDRKAIVDAKPVDLNTAKPISYFEQDDEEGATAQSPSTKSSDTIPGKGKLADPSPSSPAHQKQKTIGAAAKPVPPKTETLNVSPKGKDQIPWLVELPESK